MTTLTSWLTDTLPPETGPYLQWASAHLELITPIVVVLLALLLVGLYQVFVA